MSIRETFLFLLLQSGVRTPAVVLDLTTSAQEGLVLAPLCVSFPTVSMLVVLALLCKVPMTLGFNRLFPTGGHVIVVHVCCMPEERCAMV